MSQSIQIELSDEVLLALQTTPRQLSREIRLAAAVKWYEIGKLSQEKAAELAGLSRAEFISALAQFSVSALQETREDILKALTGK
ncbi:MAG: UPF0175 family protein [Planctomycetota bacterium]